MCPPECRYSREWGSNAFMMCALITGMIGSSVPAMINVCCRTAGKREQAGPYRTCEKLVQVANLRSGIQLPHEQLGDVLTVRADGTAVQLAGNRAA